MSSDLELDPSTDNYGVMGNPVAHSKSPRIHAAFAVQCGQKLSYRPILVEPSGFAAALDEFQRRGGKGLNVTIPFKSDAFRAVARPSPRAARAEAVNTIWFGPGGERRGDNTDGTGLVRDLERNDVPVAGKRLLIAGAGGAVSGVLGELLERRPAEIVIVNRTVARARELARRFGAMPEACGFEELAGRRFDVVINGTSLSLEGKVPALPRDILHPGACCYDFVYGDGDTAFVRWARECGAARALDGLGMLVEQAAESFHIWRGVRPQTEPVINLLRRG